MVTCKATSLKKKTSLYGRGVLPVHSVCNKACYAPIVSSCLRHPSAYPMPIYLIRGTALTTGKNIVRYGHRYAEYARSPFGKIASSVLV